MKNVHEIEIKVEGKEWEDAITKSFNKNVQNVKVDGFRKGKVPRNIFEKKFGKESLYNDAIDFVLQEKYATVIKDSKLIPIIQPTIDIKEIDDEKLVLTFRITTKPEVKIEKYTKLGVKKGVVKVTEEEVKSRINSLLEQYADIVIKDGKIENGDTAVIDFEGFKDGVAFEGGKAEGHNLVIGSGSFIPGFEDQLVGKKAGEEVDVNVTFPADYHAEDLAGAPVVFKVKVNGVKVKELPELNDEFAQDTTEFDTLAELRADVKAKAEEEAAAKAKGEERNAVVDAVVANTEIEVPETMVNAQIDNSIMELNYSLQYQGFSVEQLLEMTGKSMQELRDEKKEDAEKSVKASLVIDAIAKAENVEVTEEEVEAEAAKMAEAYNMTLAQIKEALKPSDLEDIKGQLRIRKTIDFLVENAVIA